MDSVTLVVMLALTFALAVFSAKQVLTGVLYFMARNASPMRQAAQPVAVQSEPSAAARMPRAA